MRDPHFFENSNGKFLKSIDLDRTLLCVTHVAIPRTQFTDRAQLPAGETQGVIREDDFGRAIPILILDIVYEGLNVNGR